MPRKRDDTLTKLQEEFYVVCMLNALFGNPNIHLVQLHPNYLEIKTFDKDLKEYGDPKTKAFVDSNTFVNSKKRRNAVTEVVRFICHNEEIPQKKPSNITTTDYLYDQVLIHLLNGNPS